MSGDGSWRKNHRYELYTLDISYYTDRLEALKRKKTAYCYDFGMNGVIVSAGSYMPGTYIAADTPLIAVADESQKILKCGMSVNRMWQNAKIYMQSLMENVMK